MNKAPNKTSLQAVIFDWAGTTIDYGCFSPVGPFLSLFQEYGIDLTMEQVRGPMGSLKRDHIKALLHLPEVSHKWKEKFGHAPDEDDLESLNQKFIPAQLACLPKYCELIPGVLTTFQEIKKMGLKVGTTTGYTKVMGEVVLSHAHKQSFIPDYNMCSDEVSQGRPAPWMCFEIAKKFDIYPLNRMVKVGDTPMDMAEGLNAGMWTVGVTQTGNEVGKTFQEMQEMPESDRKKLLNRASQSLKEAGAHYVIDSVADLMPVLDDINQKLGGL